MQQQSLQNHQVLSPNLVLVRLPFYFESNKTIWSQRWLIPTSSCSCYANLQSCAWFGHFSSLVLEELAEEDWKVKRELLLQKKVSFFYLSHTHMHTNFDTKDHINKWTRRIHCPFVSWKQEPIMTFESRIRNWAFQ